VVDGTTTKGVTGGADAADEARRLGEGDGVPLFLGSVDGTLLTIAGLPVGVPLVGLTKARTGCVPVRVMKMVISVTLTHISPVTATVEALGLARILLHPISLAALENVRGDGFAS
jgi:hypothetical protein